MFTLSVKNTIYFFIIPALFIIIGGTSAAHPNGIIKGNVVDKESEEVLPFASIHLVQHMSSAMANDSGYFEINIPSGSEADTLQISYIGYFDKKLAIKDLDKKVIIQLDPHPIEINEVEVLPKSAAYYLKQAFKKVQNFEPKEEYQTISYVNQDIYENGELIDKCEWVVKTFYPIFPDSVYGKAFEELKEDVQDSIEEVYKPQNQILLLETAGSHRPLNFGAKKREKKAKKAARKGEDAPEYESLIDMFEGPNMMLKIARSNNVQLSSYDTSAIKGFDNIEFSKRSTSKLMGIECSSNTYYDGEPNSTLHYFITMGSDGIPSMEGKLRTDLPSFTIQAILFAMGVGVEYLKADYDQNKRMINDKLYMSNVRVDLDAKIEKKYLFKKNEESHIIIKQYLNVNSLELDSPKAIPEEYRYDPDKPYREQVHNDIGIEWSSINRLK